nr:uncharacterized protein [Enterobacter cloacae subsp. cloacae]
MHIFPAYNYTIAGSSPRCTPYYDALDLKLALISLRRIKKLLAKLDLWLQHRGSAVDRRGHRLHRSASRGQAGLSAVPIGSFGCHRHRAGHGRGNHHPQARRRKGEDHQHAGHQCPALAARLRHDI